MKAHMATFNRLIYATAIAVFAQTSLFAQDDLSGNPLEDVVHEMKSAGDHLAKKVTDKPTQKSQQDAVAKLDALIEELEKERQQMGQGANPNPTRPAMASNVRNGPGGMGDLHGARMQGDRWGELPPHERDRILQSLTEGFPPHYQAVLEAYYKRLAVEKKGEDPDATGAAPAKSDAPPKADATPKSPGKADSKAKPAAKPNAPKAGTAASSPGTAKKPAK